MENNSLEQYSLLIEEIKSTIQEHVYQSRQALIDGYWLVGKLIREQDVENITDLVQGLAVGVGISSRTLWYAVQLYDKYPDTSKLPEGKNISWNKLITKYLPDKKEPERPIHICTCPICGNIHHS